MRNKRENVVVDTNVLLNNFDDLHDEYKITIPICVIEELDVMKKEMSERGFLARTVIKKLLEIKTEDVQYDYKNELEDSLRSDGWVFKNDNLIISSAIRTRSKLITNDYNMILKCRSVGVQAEMFSLSNYENKFYKGYREIVIDESNTHDCAIIDHIYSNEKYKDLIIDINTNEYLIIKDLTGKTLDILRYDGVEFVRLQSPNYKNNKDKFYIKAKNDQQRCAIDLLNNKNVPIKIIVGTYGSGKTWLSTRIALHEIFKSDNSIYNKLMVIRNPIGPGEKIGFLSGSKEEKISPFFKQIEQQLDGGEQDIKRMMDEGTLQYEIPYFLKGQQLENHFIIFDESEDADYKTIKMIGARLGENSCIVFVGDHKQAEKEYINNNGLVQIIDKLKGNPLVGIVVLQEDIRSKASRVFAELD